VELGETKRGREQRGKRYGLVLSPTSMAWSVATIVPTSTRAQPAAFRPEFRLLGEQTRYLVDQIRVIDTDYIHGEPVHYMEFEELQEIELAAIRYLGLDRHFMLR
jgi:mRNA interferase MazF